MFLAEKPKNDSLYDGTFLFKNLEYERPKSKVYACFQIITWYHK